MSIRTRKPSLARAQGIVCAGIKVVGSELIALPGCLHRVIRQDVVSRITYPSADVASRDGYCFRAAGTKRASARHPAALRLCGTVRSGERPGMKVGPRECVRIMTGAVLPEGADAVTPAEAVRPAGEWIRVPCTVRSGTHVRKAGTVAKRGDKVAAKGDLVRPGMLGLLGGLGVKKARVCRKVRMGIISTGDEMIGPDVNLRRWQVRDSNSMMLAGLGVELGTEVFNLGIAGDTKEEILRLLRSAKGCDLVVLTGGSSMGVSDFVPSALESHGCRVLIRGISLRPGTHLVFARKGRTVYFGLPGRPGGCFSLFHILVRPAILAMMGCAVPIPEALRAIWCGGAAERPEVDTLLEVYLGPDSRVSPVRSKGAGDLGALSRLNALALLRAGADPLKPGDAIEVFPVAWPSGRAVRGRRSGMSS
jgi:molybdopterin molybdotransferase